MVDEVRKLNEGADLDVKLIARRGLLRGGSGLWALGSG
jgi:hypothetical protein